MRRPPVMTSPHAIVRLIFAAENALPLLVRLGDFIGNGEGPTKNERCQAIADLRSSAEAAKFAMGDLVELMGRLVEALASVDLREEGANDLTADESEAATKAELDASALLKTLSAAVRGVASAPKRPSAR